MKTTFAACLIVIGFMSVSSSMAEQIVKTQPLPLTTLKNDKSGTITTTNTFQLVFNAAANDPNNTSTFRGERHGCSIQNNSVRNMYINEGTPIGSATLTNTWILGAGALWNCNFYGVVLSGEIDITGTAGDPFVAKQF